MPWVGQGASFDMEVSAGKAPKNIYSKTLEHPIFEALLRLYSTIVVIGFNAVLSE
jgi:hypothetical protein